MYMAAKVNFWLKNKNLQNFEIMMHFKQNDRPKGKSCSKNHIQKVRIRNI